MLQKIRHLINDELVETTQGPILARTSPFSGCTIYEYISASPLDFVNAIKAANFAQQTGRGLPFEARVELLNQLAQQIRTTAHELAMLSALDQGIPYKQALIYDVQKTVEIIELSLQSLNKPLDPLANGYPFGVVGIVSSRVWPLSDIMRNLAPAFLSGASVIVKPSSSAALAVAYLTELCAELNPKGTIQFLFGCGPEIGELLASHPGIDFLSFSGTTDHGVQVAQRISQNLKNGCLSLSAKNAAIILDDADLSVAAELVAKAAFTHLGQTHESISRVMISEKREAEFLERLQLEINKLKFTDPQNEDCTYGCLLEKEKVSTLQSCLNKAQSEKATLLQPLAITHSQSLAPTVVHNLHNCSDIHQIELLGPVLLSVPTKYLHESIKWANTTPFGQSALIVGQDLAKIKKAASGLRVEHIWINSWNPEKELQPRLGFKNSGWGTNQLLLFPATRLLE